jgi:histidinol-phosphate/aromatic aminotransferase/cobyric acid decarboxylase-like protein
MCSPSSRAAGRCRCRPIVWGPPRCAAPTCSPSTTSRAANGWTASTVTGAFAAWGYDEARRYKESGAGALRRRLAERLADDADLELGEATVAACAASDHALDALVCALVTRAAALGLTRPVPSSEDGARIAREGWIHLPLPDSLGRLARA